MTIKQIHSKNFVISLQGCRFLIPVDKELATAVR